MAGNLACVYQVMGVHGKLVEHQRSVRVMRGETECFSSFCRVLPTSQLQQ